MYSHKENINILTALLLDKGITDAVVCPGSRNAPIIHNLNEAPGMNCHPVTDERSAGFYALGLAQATARPVAVCVTSGSALLNVAPAVAEARYQHIPLIVVSADRPRQWIGQLDGQTLPQQGAFGPLVRCSVQLPEPNNEEERWYCRRQVNEALHLSTCRGGAPVHINVPVSEPLFVFDTEQLPAGQAWTTFPAAAAMPEGHALPDVLRTATRPMVVMGQTAQSRVEAGLMRRLARRVTVLAEPLSNPDYTVIHADGAARVLLAMDAGRMMAQYRPDCILYLGGTLVSKALRRLLRAMRAPSVLVTPDVQEVQDPLMSLTALVECPEEETGALLERLFLSPGAQPVLDAGFHRRWTALLDGCARLCDAYEPPFSQMAAVRYFESQLDDLDLSLHVHYANSSAIRLACLYAGHRVWCNRGVNGIEGSVSTAAGFSLATADMVVCITGDLSFFYDQNALWNTGLKGNLRIILLNNRGGGIFRTLPGLEASAAARSMVYAAHQADARGICTQNDIGYLKATGMDEMQVGVVTLLTQPSDRPMLLEVFTRAEDDARALDEYYRMLSRIPAAAPADEGRSGGCCTDHRNR